MRFSGSFSSTGLRGPKGDPGSSINFKATVPTIGDLPSGLQASEDDARVVTANGHVYIYNGTEWIDGGQFLGPQGEQGANGTNGTNGANGNPGIDGVDGKGYVLSTLSISPSFSNGNKFFQTIVDPSTTAYVVGSRIRISYNSTNWLEGEITSLDTVGPVYGVYVDIDKYTGSNGGGGSD